jgi:hypothetical protein
MCFSIDFFLIKKEGTFTSQEARNALSPPHEVRGREAMCARMIFPHPTVSIVSIVATRSHKAS